MTIIKKPENEGLKKVGGIPYPRKSSNGKYCDQIGTQRLLKSKAYQMLSALDFGFQTVDSP